MYGCVATFTGVWIIAWVPPEEPSTESDDEVGTIGVTETMAHDVFVANGVSAGGSVGRRPGNVRSRRSTVSLVGISPAQVQSSIFVLQRANIVDLFLQRLLLLHTPPRSEVQLGQEHGVVWEAEPGGREREGFDGSMRRWHAVTWRDRSPRPRPRTRLRSVERRWTSDGSQNGEIE
jgi:hypothetical protein